MNSRGDDVGVALRAEHMSMSKIAAEVGVSVGKVHEVLTGIHKAPSIGTSDRSTIAGCS